MSTQFWRFAYEEDSLKSIVNSENLPFPEFKQLSDGKHNSVADVISSMKAGSVIILANFNAVENSATVRAVGKVKDIKEEEIQVEWKKLVPSVSLYPHKIGAKQWSKESVFLINPQRVRDFKLDKIANKLF